MQHHQENIIWPTVLPQLDKVSKQLSLHLSMSYHYTYVKILTVSCIPLMQFFLQGYDVVNTHLSNLHLHTQPQDSQKGQQTVRRNDCLKKDFAGGIDHHLAKPLTVERKYCSFVDSIFNQGKFLYMISQARIIANSQ